MTGWEVVHVLAAVPDPVGQALITFGLIGLALIGARR